MLESFAINICVPTAGTDRYDEVAINKHPIIVLGRETDLHNTLKSETIKAYIVQHIRTQELFESAKFYIQHINRDNTATKLEIPVKDMVIVSGDQWEVE